ncbi:MAG: hypothetical protein LBM71_03350 [Elusimicrobiota bacterium]|jgi:biotin carboxyl carrier protein|nr:hypothetical protein [Elusimicrobiota bacterium]
MDTKTLSDFITWSKTTDLQEIIYKKNGIAIDIKTAAATPAASDFSCKLDIVAAPALGIYHAGKKGKALALKENMPVKKGDLLGTIEMNKTLKDVLATIDGVLKVISITDGLPTEFGQPLFFIEPK